MRLVLQIPDQHAVTIDKAELSIGSDPSGDVYLPNSRGTEAYARILCQSDAVWLIRNEDSGSSVHLNGRRVQAKALLHAGDELHFDGFPVQVKSETAPVSDKPPSSRVLNFSDRILVRAHCGAQSGKAFALVNSLCIGRSGISEIRVDDPAMAERQILLQRQGNEVLVKNLSPALEMRVDGWVCNEALLKPGSQLNIEQQRFTLESPVLDLMKMSESTVIEPLQLPAEPDDMAPLPKSEVALFNRSQWILLASAVVISTLLVLLLTLSP
jgi:pSer/pThr/pTyr-binding forkhead associated (FHA) protein